MKIVNLQDYSIDDISYLLPDIGDSIPQLTAWQVTALGKEVPRDCFVTVPDFLHYARIIKSGRPLSILGLSEHSLSATMAGLQASIMLACSPMGLVKKDFWLVAQALVKFDLSLLPYDFAGTIVLHPYLNDFVLSLKKEEFIRDYCKMCGNKKWGIETQQILMTLSYLSKHGLAPNVIIHTENKDSVLPVAQNSKLFQRTEFLVDVDYLPRVIQKKYKNAVMSI